MERRVDVKGYPVTVLGEYASEHLQQMNREYGRMKLALYRILHMNADIWGAQGVCRAQTLAAEGLGRQISDEAGAIAERIATEGLPR